MTMSHFKGFSRHGNIDILFFEALLEFDLSYFFFHFLDIFLDLVSCLINNLSRFFAHLRVQFSHPLKDILDCSFLAKILDTKII